MDNFRYKLWRHDPRVRRRRCDVYTQVENTLTYIR